MEPTPPPQTDELTVIADTMEELERRIHEIGSLPDDLRTLRHQIEIAILAYNNLDIPAGAALDIVGIPTDGLDLTPTVHEDEEEWEDDDEDDEDEEWNAALDEEEDAEEAATGEEIA